MRSSSKPSGFKVLILTYFNFFYIILYRKVFNLEKIIMRKQTVLIMVFFAIICVLSILCVACDKQNDTSREEPKQPIFYAVYAYAQDAGYTGTMEELIELFKGENAYQLAVASGYNGTQEEWLLSLVGASGRDGVTPMIGANKHWFIGDIDTGVIAEGKDGQDGVDGRDGKGIDRVEKIDSNNDIDTYAIIFTDGTTTMFEVKNGKDAERPVEHTHEYGEWTVVAPSTCLDNGARIKICKTCGATYGEIIEPLGHNYLENIIAPTCTSVGYTEHICARCADSYCDNETEKTEHAFEAYGDVDKYCALSTYQHYKCSHCELEKQEFIKGVSGVSTCHNELEVGTVCSYCGHSVYSKSGDVVFMDLGNGDLSAEFYGTTVAGVNSDLIENVIDIFFADSVISIEEFAFDGYIALESVVIPNSVTSIADAAFFECISLKSIVISEATTNIGAGAFAGCSELITISVVQGNPIFHSSGNCLIRTANNELVIGCKNSTIPTDGSVTSIGSYAFGFCLGLTSITIPNGIDIIGESAFEDSASMELITIANSVTTIKNSAFDSCESLKTINYEGTKDQWNAIVKENNWDRGTGNYTIHCTDGDIAKA